MAATHFIPSEPLPESKYNHLLMPAHASVSFAALENIIVDDFSLSLLEKAPKNERFAWIGFFITEGPNTRLELYCRPGFSSTITEAEKKAAETIYGKEIVIAKEGNPGQVHDETIDLVNKRRESQGLTPFINGRKSTTPGAHPIVGFSSTKTNDSMAFEWINRSIYNTNSFTVDTLASAGWLYTSTKSDTKYLMNSNMYNIERSLPIRFFDAIVNHLAKLFKEPDQTFYCYTAKYEKEWDNILKLGSPEKERRIGNNIFRLIYFSAEDRDIGYMEKIMELYNLAKEHHISIDLNFAPDNFEEQGEIIHVPRNQKGETLLMMACEHPKTDLELFLLSKGANPNIQNKEGETALFYAIRNDKPPILTWLSYYGMDPHIKNNHQENIMHIIAKENSNREMINFLLNYEREVNIRRGTFRYLLTEKNAAGETPIMIAAKNAQWPMVNLFINSSHNATSAIESIKSIQSYLTAAPLSELTKTYQDILKQSRSIVIYETLLNAYKQADPNFMKTKGNEIFYLLESSYEQYQTTPGTIVEKINAWNDNTLQMWSFDSETIELALKDIQASYEENIRSAQAEDKRSSSAKILSAIPTSGEVTELKVNPDQKPVDAANVTSQENTSPSSSFEEDATPPPNRLTPS